MRSTGKLTRRAAAQRCAAAVAVLVLTACGAAAPIGPTTAGTGTAPAATATESTAASSSATNGLGDATLYGVASDDDGDVSLVGAHDGAAAAWTAGDAGTWQPAQVEDAADVDRLRAVASGPGGFVAFGGPDDVASSIWTADAGSVWTPAEAVGVDARINGVTAASGGWLAVGDLLADEGGGAAGGVVLRSDDGLTWEIVTDRLRIGDGTVSDVAVGGDAVVAVGFDVDGGRIWYDPASTPVPVDGDFEAVTIQGVAANDDGFVALGRDARDQRPVAWTSPDGRAWERVDLPAEAFPPTDDIHDLTATGDGLLAVGAAPGGGVVWTSADGLTWRRTGPE